MTTLRLTYPNSGGIFCLQLQVLNSSIKRSHIPEDLSIDHRPVRTSKLNKSYCYIPPVHSNLFSLIYFAARASQYINLNINQLDALNFIMSLFHASTCFGHKCSSSGGQNCIIQPLVSSHLQVACARDGHL